VWRFTSKGQRGKHKYGEDDDDNLRKINEHKMKNRKVKTKIKRIAWEYKKRN